MSIHWPGSRVIAAAVLLSGCGTDTVFDYSIPIHSPDRRATFDQIDATASLYAAQYVTRANGVAGASQAFDLLTMAGAAGAVFATIFRASQERSKRWPPAQGRLMASTATTRHARGRRRT